MPKSAALKRLIVSLNEADPAVRDRKLSRIWSPSTRLRINGAAIPAPRQRLDAAVTTWLEDPRYVVRLLWSHRLRDQAWGQLQIAGVRIPSTFYDVRAVLTDDGTFSLVDLRVATEAARPGLPARVLTLLSGNPLALTGLLGGSLYLALRIPLGLFYNDLGVPADDVGFGPQVLVPQSLPLLLGFVAWMSALLLLSLATLPGIHGIQAAGRLASSGRIALATLCGGVIAATALAGMWSLGELATTDQARDNREGLVIALALPCVLLVASISSIVLARVVPPFRDHMVTVADNRRRTVTPADTARRFAALAATYSAMLFVALVPWALFDADDVRAGGAAGGRLLPWRALPVQLDWKATSHEPAGLVNRCRTLRLLGVANGQMVLFDTTVDKLFRVPVADASASVDRDCV